MRDDLPSLITRALDIAKKYSERSKNGNIEELLKTDMLNMLVYLSSNQAGRRVKDVLFINKLLSTKFDVISIRDYELRNGINREDFSSSVPPSIFEMIVCERDYNGFTCSFYKDTREIYKMLKELGYYFIALDDFMSPDEVDKITKYTNNIINYILKEESLDYLSFDNVGADVKIDMKGGISFKGMVNVDPSRDDTDNRLMNLDTKVIGNHEIEECTETIEELLEQINKLIGLDSVKEEVNNLVNLIRVQKMRRDRGMKVPNVGLHLVFTGNPGTGKTTIARTIAKIYKTLGLLQYGHMVETGRAGLVAGYMGQTAGKVESLVSDSLGGVLFIDEAYTLISSENDDFGKEAVDTLLKEMEDKREQFAVIVAGYPDRMEKFLLSNPGLKSRFNRTIVFEDYSVDELVSIFQKFCTDNQYKLSNDALVTLHSVLQGEYDNRDENFGNARDARKLFEKVVTNQANRIMKIYNANDDDIITIKAEDLA